nr:hypothetical protein [Tanacetum cinerariifolium]
MAPLPPADQRHPWLRYEVEGYTSGIVHIYEKRLETIWSRPVNRVYVLDFAGLTLEMRHDLVVRLRIIYSREGRGFRDYRIEISSGRDFLGPAPSYVLIQDLVRRLCHRMIAYSISGRGQAPKKVTSIDLFYLRRMDHRTIDDPPLLGLVGDEGLRGLQVVTRELPLIDLHKLGRLHICTRHGDTWAWVAQGLERQQAATTSAHEVNKAGLAAEERHVRPKTGDASTFAVPDTDVQPDP